MKATKQILPLPATLVLNLDLQYYPIKPKNLNGRASSPNIERDLQDCKNRAILNAKKLYMIEHNSSLNYESISERWTISINDWIIEYRVIEPKRVKRDKKYYYRWSDENGNHHEKKEKRLQIGAVYD